MPGLKLSEQTVLLTGAAGLLGRQLTRYLSDRGVKLRALVREASSVSLGTVGSEFESVIEWRVAREDPVALSALLDGVTAVVHLASTGSGAAADRQETHVTMPQALLDSAAASSVQQFVSLSSVKAIAGEAHPLPLLPNTTPAPNSEYGRFKLAAEKLVSEHAANSVLATYTLRLPMVYGLELAGNFRALRTAARLNLPLPVAANNRRSLLFTENLFDCIAHLLATPPVAGHRLLHLADGEAVSTREFFQLIARAQGSPGWCVTLPASWGLGLSRVPLLGGLTARLLGSLQFDEATLNAVPQWSAPFTTAEGIAAAVAAQDSV